MSDIVFEDIAKKQTQDKNNPDYDHSRRNFILKACVFATGLAGIVAEYVLATLASYLLGNAVLQWTLTVSLILFAMGIGSRLSQYIRRSLLDAFIAIEFALSFLCALSATMTYLLSAYIENITIIIYPLSVSIGILIGLEIPLVTRLNDYYEDLRVNISSVMEKDYYGALLGGIFFAFVALPKFGLTYTPIILGGVNFLVASILFLQYYDMVKFKKIMTSGFVIVPVFLIALAYLAKPVVLYGEQRKYRDLVIYEQQSMYQRIVLTQWKDNYWLYLDGHEQFSSYDEERYHEPLVHPAMNIGVSRENVLILGGGDGLAVREVLKYPDVKQITLVDIDPAITDLAKTHPIFLKLNFDSLNNPKVRILNQDALTFLKNSDRIFDVIIIDLPDPKTVGLARLYTRQFYHLAGRHLALGGTLVTQATSPFFSKQAFLSILKTIQATELTAVAFHNHIPTMGEWAWVIGINLAGDSNPQMLKTKLSELAFDHIETRFLNQAAMIAMLNFGKGTLDQIDTVAVNDRLDLVIYRYYRRGAWDIY